MAAKGLKESASAQTWRKVRWRTESISDTEYPDGIDTGGFKQTKSPADGRFREGKGLWGFEIRCAVSPPGQGTGLHGRTAAGQKR